MQTLGQTRAHDLWGSKTQKEGFDNKKHTWGDIPPTWLNSILALSQCCRLVRCSSHTHAVTLLWVSFLWLNINVTRHEKTTHLYFYSTWIRPSCIDCSLMEQPGCLPASLMLLKQAPTTSHHRPSLKWEAGCNYSPANCLFHFEHLFSSRLCPPL